MSFVLKDMWYRVKRMKNICKPCIWQSITPHTQKQAGEIAQVVKIPATKVWQPILSLEPKQIKVEGKNSENCDFPYAYHSTGAPPTID